MKENIQIRKEEEKDYLCVHDLITQAFRYVKESDHCEQYLVERLRQSDAFVPELSLVAETDEKKIVGYILLTKVEIVSKDSVTPSLAVAPLAVLPEFQQQGIGGMLLREAHRRGTLAGFGSAVLLGHKDYYPKFGYRKATDMGISFPFDAPAECCMVVELRPHALHQINGTVRYPHAFFK